MSGDDGFLSRWSKRKKAVAEADAVEEELREDQLAAANEAEAGAEDDEELTDEQILEKYGLKDPDTLEEGDNFAGFLRAAIPEHMRRRALRRLWRSNPMLANLDGLNDYDGDWTGGSVPAGEQLKTAYRVGLGYLQKLTAPADDAPAPEEVPGEPEPKPEIAAADTEEPPSAIADEPRDDAAGAVEEDSGPSEDHGRTTRRRMAFRVPSR